MTINDLTERLGVTRMTVVRWVAAGCPRTKKDGQSVFDYDLPAVQAWVANRKGRTVKAQPVVGIDLGRGPSVTSVTLMKGGKVVDHLAPLDRMKLPTVPPLSIPAGLDGRQQLIAQLQQEARDLLAKTLGGRWEPSDLAKAELLHGQALAVGAGGNNRWGGL